MKILALGSTDRLNEFQEIIADKDSLVVSSYDEIINKQEDFYNEFDLIADLNLDEFPERIHSYKNLSGKLILGCAVKKSLAEISSGATSISCLLAGVNCLPCFIRREMMEVSFPDEKTKGKFADISRHLRWNWREVKDSVGMVTPRIICMLVNEACCTLEAGTASKYDIDKGMKLGTAYPFGPLEWADRIGIKNIYETLIAVQNTDKDARYKISSLLKLMYDRKQTFYS